MDKFNEVEKFEKNGFLIINGPSSIEKPSIAISLDKAFSDLECVYKNLEDWSSQNKNAQYKSLVFTVNDTTLRKTDKAISEMIKIFTKYIAKNQKLSLLSVGVTRNDVEDDDIFHSYNDKTKSIMQDIANLSDKVVLLDLDSKQDIFFATDLEEIKKNNLLVENDKIEDVRKKIYQIADLIKSKTTSPYEQHLLALHYISQYKYTLNDEHPYLESRSLSEIVENDAKYICCVGYARFYTEVMRALGFDAQTQCVTMHLRAKILMKEDPKYGIKEGVYVVEPTWLSAMQNHKGKKRSFNFSKLANLNLKSIVDEVNLRFECDKKNPVAMKRKYENEKILYEKLKHDYKKFESMQLSDFKILARAEYYETGADFYSKIAEHIDSMNKRKQSKLVKESDIFSFMKECQPQEPNLDMAYFNFVSLTKNEQLQKMQDFLDSVQDLIESNFKVEDCYKIRSYLYEQAQQFGIPLSVAYTAFKSSLAKIFEFQTAFETDLEEIFGIQSENLDKVLKITNGSIKKYFEFTSNFAMKIVKNLPDYPKYDDFIMSTLTNPPLKKEKLNQNFSSLSDEKFQQIFQSTQTIDNKTLEKAVQNITGLVKKEDYVLFKQNPHGKGSHKDLAFEL